MGFSFREHDVGRADCTRSGTGNTLGTVTGGAESRREAWGGLRRENKAERRPSRQRHGTHSRRPWWVRPRSLGWAAGPAVAGGVCGRPWVLAWPGAAVQPPRQATQRLPVGSEEESVPALQVCSPVCALHRQARGAARPGSGSAAGGFSGGRGFSGLGSGQQAGGGALCYVGLGRVQGTGAHSPVVQTATRRP